MQKKTLYLILGILSAAAIAVFAQSGNQRSAATAVKPDYAQAGLKQAGAALTRKSPDQYNAMMAELSTNMKSWGSLHPDDQRIALAAVIQLLAQQGNGKISQTPAYYADWINQTLLTNKEVLAMPLDRVLVIHAVMDYDFDNGKDKDLLAQEILGPSMYEANKARRQKLGLPAEEVKP
ncbi:MAG: hypothetical protein FGM27_09185 [Candidatus Omnitrophica bacterium]|nr:hypothetical protein [Candidatus Omnitrophota bacterium]